MQHESESVATQIIDFAIDGTDEISSLFIGPYLSRAEGQTYPDQRFWVQGRDRRR